MASTQIPQPPLTKPQIRAFLAAWVGWAFDGLDGFIYGLVALRFVKELLGSGASDAEASFKAALIQAVFLVGWAVGGAYFGRVGDKLGRARTLTLTIVLYAIFTGAAFFAHAWWHLLIFRFIAALGIGGEWAAGSALVSETLPKRFSHVAGAILQSGYISGMILAAVTVGALGSLSPRYVFLIGVLPAFLTIWIRKAVPEPAEWQGEKSKAQMPPMMDLFRGANLPVTLFTIGLTSVALTGVWAVLFFSTQVIQKVPEVAALGKAAQADVIRHVTIVYALWNIAGNFFAAAIARYAGYRRAFSVLFLMAFTTYFLGFREAHNLADTQLWLSATMFFGSGVFALFPAYIPPLFPVLLRTSGSGLCYNIGRLSAAVGTLFGGAIAGSAGGPHLVIWYVGFLYIPGLVITAALPLRNLSEPDTLSPSRDA